MKGAGDQLFAATTFTGDQNSSIAARDLLHSTH
jgi:hypothetical protein